MGMGRVWAERSREAARVFAQADEILGDRLGAPISSLCFEGPPERLNQTDVSQPAIYVTSMACLAGLRAQWGAGNGELPLAACAGLSLGEYTALTVAGAMDFASGLELVTLRGRAMQEAAVASPSGMVALIGADEGQARELCERARGPEVLVPANFNAPGQVVVSGSLGACERAERVASEMGLKATRLAVAGAFHSPLMKPAADRLATALASVRIVAPRCPVLSNVTGVAHEAGEGCADVIRRRLVEQLTSPVRWADNGRWLGERYAGAAYHELAPGKTLSGLMRRIDRNLKVETHDEVA